ncbi:MAG: HlyD family type I secretion periplasmic adaptor subunit, partial [Polymorphobacter sp.]
TAIAAGRVAPARALQQVSNLEGGRVTAIVARPGDRVTAGQLLLRLDPDAAAADLGRSSSMTAALKARIVRLEAESSGTAQAFGQMLPDAVVAGEHALWAARRAELVAIIAGDAARRDAATRAQAEADSAVRVQAEARAQAAREVAMLVPLVDKGIEPAISLARARSALAQAEAAAGAAAAAARRASALVTEARAAGRAAESRFRSAAADALTVARAELASQTAALPALRGRVDRTAVRSPIAGTVQRVLVATIGGTVAAGAPLVEIVPAGEALVIDADVRPSDIAFVHLGQEATVRLSAYDPSVYGSIKGEVSRISPDAVINERTGASHFSVRITTSDAALKAPDGAPLPIGPGMVAEVSFTGRKRSILSYLFAPVTRLGQNAFRER